MDIKKKDLISTLYRLRGVVVVLFGIASAVVHSVTTNKKVSLYKESMGVYQIHSMYVFISLFLERISTASALFVASI